MDFKKVKFSSFIPGYEKYFDILKTDKSITNYVSFSKYDSSLIFYDNDFAGFYKTMYRDDDLTDREIYIALIEKYRGMGLASYVINYLTNNIFDSDKNCEFVHLSIDKDNKSSINMAINCGYNINKELTKENIDMKDERTLVFSKKNPNYKQSNDISSNYKI
jgi:RimJ/RimL family protein N-acetyltransferase